MYDTIGDRDEIPPGLAVLVAAALVMGLAVLHFLIGAPSGAREWLLLAAMAVVAPALGYKAAVREFDAGFAVCGVGFALILVVAGV